MNEEYAATKRTTRQQQEDCILAYCSTVEQHVDNYARLGEQFKT